MTDRMFKLFKVQEIAIGGHDYNPVGRPTVVAVYLNSCGHEVDLHMAYCPGCGKPTDLGARGFELRVVALNSGVSDGK